MSQAYDTGKPMDVKMDMKRELSVLKRERSADERTLSLSAPVDVVKG
jgi:hypothetical protein